VEDDPGSESVLVIDPNADEENDSFVNECLGCLVLDCGCVSTVGGKTSVEAYLDYLKSVGKDSSVVYRIYLMTVMTSS